MLASRSCDVGLSYVNGCSCERELTCLQESAEESSNNDDSNNNNDDDDDDDDFKE